MNDQTQQAEKQAIAERAFVALGANLGDRMRALGFAVTTLAETPGVDLVGSSAVYETAPVGPPPQGPYLNAVVVVETTLAPAALLAVLLEIEQRAGRKRSGRRDEARTLDCDLLLHGDHCLALPGLEVPHPRLHERAFVLEPLCDACARVGAPETRHPKLGLTLLELAAAVRDPDAVRPHAGPLIDRRRGRAPRPAPR